MMVRTRRNVSKSFSEPARDFPNGEEKKKILGELVDCRQQLNRA